MLLADGKKRTWNLLSEHFFHSSSQTEAVQIQAKSMYELQPFPKQGCRELKQAPAETSQIFQSLCCSLTTQHIPFSQKRRECISVRPRSSVP